MLEGVTDGPWRWVFHEGEVVGDPGNDVLVSETSRTLYPGGMTWGGEHDFPTEVVIGIAFEDETVALSVHSANANFIAAARTLVPELIAEIERLRVEAQIGRKWVPGAVGDLFVLVGASSNDRRQLMRVTELNATKGSYQASAVSVAEALDDLRGRSAGDIPQVDPEGTRLR
jgi:hypothetical protein